MVIGVACGGWAGFCVLVEKVGLGFVVFFKNWGVFFEFFFKT